MFSLVRPDLIEKQALIISNKNYSRKQNQLTDSNETIHQLETNLKNIHFNVTYHKDLVNEEKIMDAVIAFARTVKNGDVVLFYLDGYAVEVNGKNYFIPIDDTRIQCYTDIEVYGVYLNRMLERLTENKPSCTFIVIMDCCRPYFIVAKTVKKSRLMSVICSFVSPDQSCTGNLLLRYYSMWWFVNYQNK